MSDYVVVDEQQVYKLPEGYGYEKAALTEPVFYLPSRCRYVPH